MPEEGPIAMPITCRHCGQSLPGPEMSAEILAHFLAHIQAMHTPFQLRALADTIVASYLGDAATSSLLGVIEKKLRRIVREQ